MKVEFHQSTGATHLKTSLFNNLNINAVNKILKPGDWSLLKTHATNVNMELSINKKNISDELDRG